MKKQALWAILGAMLGAGGAVALKPAFDSEASIQPNFKSTRIALFEVSCPPVAPVVHPAVTHEQPGDAGEGGEPYTEVIIDTPAWTDYGPDAGPCKGIEVVGAVYATTDPNARAVAVGSASVNAVEPPQDAGIGPLAKIEQNAKQAIRAARADGGTAGKVKGTIHRVVLFGCEGCSTFDGGTPWGIEACDDEGCVSTALDNFPAEVRRYAKDVWESVVLPPDGGTP